MTSVPETTKPATVSMTFTVTKTLPANPKVTELDAIKKAASDTKNAVAAMGGTVTGHVVIGKQKFEL
jgi:hypothetical protein